MAQLNDLYCNVSVTETKPLDKWCFISWKQDNEPHKKSIGRLRSELILGAPWFCLEICPEFEKLPYSKKIYFSGESINYFVIIPENVKTERDYFDWQNGMLPDSEGKLPYRTRREYLEELGLPNWVINRLGANELFTQEKLIFLVYQFEKHGETQYRNIGEKTVRMVREALEERGYIEKTTGEANA